MDSENCEADVGDAVSENDVIDAVNESDVNLGDINGSRLWKSYWEEDEEDVEEFTEEEIKSKCVYR